MTRPPNRSLFPKRKLTRADASVCSIAQFDLYSQTQLRPSNHSCLAQSNSDLLVRTGEGRIHGKRQDGTEYDRRLTALGAYSQTDGLGRVEMILRTDTSAVFAIYLCLTSPPMIEELSADQKQRLLWTYDQDRGDFVCAGQPRRHKLELTSNGNLSFIQGNIRIIITGDGTRLSEPTSKKLYGFDEEGRIVQIDYGRKIRQFGFIEKTRELASVAVFDLASNSRFFHERIGDSNEWSVRDHHGNLYATWCGTRHLTASADYVYQEHFGSSKAGICHVCRPDGTEFKVEMDQYTSLNIGK